MCKKLEYLERTTDHGQKMVSFSICGCESSAAFLTSITSIDADLIEDTVYPD
jgi:hypothetical protein